MLTNIISWYILAISYSGFFFYRTYSVYILHDVAATMLYDLNTTRSTGTS